MGPARVPRPSRRADAEDDAALFARAAPRPGPQALHGGRAAVSAAAFDRVVERVRELDAGYAPPDFAHVPDPDAALFLCAVDHKAGYERPHRVGGQGPFSGSELMWVVALAGAPGRGGCGPRRSRRSPPARSPTCSGSTTRRSPTRVAGPSSGATSPPGSNGAYGGAAASAAGRRRRPPRRAGRAARAARGVSRLRRPAGEEGAAAGEDLRAPRVVRGRRSRELGGLGRQRADAPGAALRAGRARGLAEVRAATRAEFKRVAAAVDPTAATRRPALGTRPLESGPARKRGRRPARAATRPRSSWY